MAAVLRIALGLQAMGAVSGVRDAASAEGAEEFPIRGWAAAGAILGQGNIRDGASAPTSRVSGWANQVSQPVNDWPKAVGPRNGMPLMAARNPSIIGNLPKAWAYNLVGAKEVAEGQDSLVFMARLKENPDQRVAVKRVIPHSDEQVRELVNEVHWLSHFKQAPGIVTMYRVAYDSRLAPGTEAYLLLEPALGSLREHAFSSSFIEVSSKARLKLFADIVRGLNELEEAGLGHGDLSPDNILVVGECKGLGDCNAVLSGLGKVSNRTISMRFRDNALLANVLYQLLTKGFSNAVEGLSEFTGYAGSDRALAGLVQIWQKMVDPGDRLDMPTAEVLQAVEALAEECGVDVSPREVPKLMGWSKVRGDGGTEIPRREASPWQ